MSKLRHRLTYANVMATVAVFIALGGSSYAAVTLKRSSVKGKHIAANAVTSPKVKNASLLSEDFAPGQLPQGPQGERGPEGPPNPNAENSERLDDIDSTGFATGRAMLKAGADTAVPRGSERSVFVGDTDATRGPSVLVEYACPASTGVDGTVTLTNTSGGPVEILVDGVAGTDTSDQARGASGDVVAPARSAGEHLTFAVQGTGGVAIVEVFSMHRPTRCVAYALYTGEG